MSKKEYYEIKVIINKKERQAYRRAVTDIFCGLATMSTLVLTIVAGVYQYCCR